MQVARVAPDWPVSSLMHRRRVLGDRITYVGLDVHKEGIVVAVAEGGERGEVREYGRIANTPAALRRLAGKLGQQGVELRFCYEAGPVRVWHPTPVVGAWPPVHCGGTIADPQAARRQGEDGSAGRCQSGEAASGWRADGGVGSRSRP